MHSRKVNLIVIVGPTAAGKSALAVRLAKRLGGEIISADSRQIYRGLNIGAGKVPGRWVRANVATPRRPLRSCNFFVYREITHHCIDLVSPGRTFTAAEYQKCAKRAIADITGRGNIPILVGGTGFWVDAVAYDLELPAIRPNPALRRRLARKPARELLTMLERLDPERARTIEPQNPRRLIRAIEIARALGRVPELKKRSPYRLLWIGLHPPPSRLRRNIAAFAAQIVRRGLMPETRTLLRRVGRSRMHEFGFEYRAALACLAGRITRSELRAILARDLRAYARRQMAWFRRNPEIRWIGNPREAEALVRQFIVCPPEYLAPTAVGARMNGGYKQ